MRLIEESNVRRDAQIVETTKMVADHGQIFAEQSIVLASHNQRIAFQDEILSDTKKILM